MNGFETGVIRWERPSIELRLRKSYLNLGIQGRLVPGSTLESRDEVLEVQKFEVPPLPPLKTVTCLTVILNLVKCQAKVFIAYTCQVSANVRLRSYDLHNASIFIEALGLIILRLFFFSKFVSPNLVFHKFLSYVTK